MISFVGIVDQQYHWNAFISLQIVSNKILNVEGNQKVNLFFMVQINRVN